MPAAAASSRHAPVFLSNADGRFVRPGQRRLRLIQISALVYAKFFRTRRMAGLKQSKYPAKKENQIPYKYYRPAIAAIIRYHKKNNDPAVFDDAIAKLQEKIDSAEQYSKTIAPRHNLRAIENYRLQFKNRQFKPESISPMHFLHADVLVGAKPEMVAIEKGERKLVRFDMKIPKPDQVEVDALLDIMYLSAVAGGVHVQAEDVLLLRLEDGSCFNGRKVTSSRRSQLKDACKEIKDRWEEI